MPLDLTATLADLISIPSVNPMGLPVEGPEFFEYRMTEYLDGLFKKLDLPYKRYHVAEKRENILIRVDGDQTPPEKGGPLVLLEAHQDTVPVTGMTIDPWKPEIKNGRIYGRGSCDIKGGMTSMIGTIERLAREKPKNRPTVVLACVADEEFSFKGATALTQIWKQGKFDAMVAKQPDVCVVTEPTSLDVVVAHKGTMRWRIHTHGRAGHSSQPQLADNAVYKMARVLLALEQYAKEIVGGLGSHPLCGKPTLSVGIIRGGISCNTVPDKCTIELCRRVIPGQMPMDAQKHIIDWLAARPEIAALGDALEHETPFNASAPLPDDKNGALADRLSEVSRARTGKGKKIGVPYGTDASRISGADVPSVVFGPGSIDQAHTCDEWLPLDELAPASEVLYEFCRTWSA